MRRLTATLTRWCRYLRAGVEAAATEDHEMKPLRFRSRPRYVEGFAWDGEPHPAVHPIQRDGRTIHVVYTTHGGYVEIHPGDFLYRHTTDGHWDAINPNAFLRLYEPVDEAA